MNLADLLPHLLGLLGLLVILAAFERRIHTPIGRFLVAAEPTDFGGRRQIAIDRHNGVVWATPCDDPCEAWELNAPDMTRARRRRALAALAVEGVDPPDLRRVQLFIAASTHNNNQPADERVGADQ